jgi:hypothetical protein
MARVGIGLFLLMLLATGAMLGIGLVAAFEGVPMQALALALGASFWLMAFLFALSIAPIAIWIYRAHANLIFAGVQGLTYRPLWAVGSFFVPLVNLFVPFKAMRQLHNRSHGEGVEQADSAVNDVTSWWGCHLAAVLVWTFLILVAAINLLTNLHVVAPGWANAGLMALALLLLGGSAAYLFRTIGAVTRAQRSMMYFNAAEVFA